MRLLPLHQCPLVLGRSLSEEDRNTALVAVSAVVFVLARAAVDLVVRPSQVMKHDSAAVVCPSHPSR